MAANTEEWISTCASNSFGPPQNKYTSVCAKGPLVSWQGKSEAFSGQMMSRKRQVREARKGLI